MKGVIGLILGGLISLGWVRELPVKENVVFQNGQSGYKCYRIPAIVKAPNGDLLAFVEARRNNCGDFGDVEIVMKRSTDNGASWSAPKVVADNGNDQAGNPAPVFDLADKKFPQGRLFLFYNTGTVHEQEVREGKALREVWYKTSTDGGQTWSAGVNITGQVSKPTKPEVNPKYKFKEDWRTYANTPGHGLQLTKGKYKGRIFIAANHSVGPPQKDSRDYISHGFYSDDHGKTFRIASDVAYPSSNEATAAQAANGDVVINCRNQSGDAKYRIQAFSKNGGATWEEVKIMKDLPDPICQGSMIEYRPAKGKSVLLFSNLNHQSKRANLTVRVSHDNGRSWSAGKEIYGNPSTYEDPAAYSDLVVQQDNKIGVLYEKNDYTQVVYALFSYEWLVK
ncbi:sialidase family protein [Runella zeae]|uniref:sialidase family protein n=1 Tax=Runella zeae TaxID=94255 RepID=UPI0004187643|nr:sialidase family protein [Runella zeae]